MLLRPIAFRLRNFKSIRDSGICSLSGDGVTVLAGQNEAGKTSILEALELFDGSHKSVPQLEDAVPDDEPTLTPSVSIAFSFSWVDLLKALIEKDIALEPPIEEVMQRGRLWLERDLLTGKFSTVEDLKAAMDLVDQVSLEESDPYPEATTDYGEKAKYVTNDELFEFFYQQFPNITYFDSFDDLLPRRVPIDLISKVVGTLTKTTEPELGSAATNFLSVARVNLKEVRRLAALDDDEKQLSNYLDQRSRAVSKDFFGILASEVGPKEQVNLKIRYSHKADGAALLFYAEDNGIFHFPDQRSKGFLWFLSFYLSLAASGGTSQHSRGQWVLIDEPGSFLHPKAQHDILDLLQKRLINDGDVVTYSTHSPYLLPVDRLDRIRIVFKDNENRTVIADRLNDERLKGDIRGDAMAPVWDAIGIQLGESGLGNLTNREQIVVEGITDHYYLYAWVKLLGNTLLDERKITIATGTPLVPYSVSIAIASGKNFVVLLDRDDAGNAAAKKLVSELNIDQACVVQPRNAFGVEDLLSPRDFKNLCAVYDPLLNLDGAMRPTAVIKKFRIDKVLLARKFAELVGTCALTQGELEQQSIDSATSLLNELTAGLEIDPIYRVT